MVTTTATSTLGILGRYFFRPNMMPIDSSPIHKVGIWVCCHGRLHHPHHRLIVVLRLLHGDAEELAQLGGGDDQGAGVGEADDHRVGQEVHQHAEAEHAEEELEGADHEGQQHRIGQIALGAARGQRPQGGGGHQRDHRDRAGGELAGGAEQGRHHGRQKGGVQAVVDRQPGELGIGHGLGYQHQGDGDAGDDVGTQGVLVFQSPIQPRNGRK